MVLHLFFLYSLSEQWSYKPLSKKGPVSYLSIVGFCAKIVFSVQKLPSLPYKGSYSGRFSSEAALSRLVILSRLAKPKTTAGRRIGELIFTHCICASLYAILFQIILFTILILESVFFRCHLNH